MMDTRITDEELSEWEQDDPYNSILQRKRMPRLIAALRAERAELERWEDLVPLVNTIDELRTENNRLRNQLATARQLVRDSADFRVDL